MVGTRGVVATVHPIASRIALDILKDGGNAIDAAVGAGLALGVVDGFNSGIGGGCFILIRRADGQVVALDGRETAPAAAQRDMFLREGKADPDLSRKGPLAVGVPGALAAYQWALQHHGTRSIDAVIQPSAKVAREGFTLGPDYVRRLKGAVEKLREFPGAAAIFLNDAHALEVGDKLVQEDLAATYDGIAGEGIDYFYRGPVARKIARWMKAHGGLLTEADFAAYEPVPREPIRSTYRDYEILGFPPPSSGGVHVAQMLNMLESFDLAGLSEADRAHVLAEAMKLAFADRAHWLGDPGFAKVPRGLIDKVYAADLAKKISLRKPLPFPRTASLRRRLRLSLANTRRTSVSPTAWVTGWPARRQSIPPTARASSFPEPASSSTMKWMTLPPNRGSPTPLDCWGRCQRRGPGQTPALEHEPDHRPERR